MKLRTLLLALVFVLAFAVPVHAAGAGGAEKPHDVVKNFYEKTYNNNTRNEDEIEAYAKKLKLDFFHIADEESAAMLEIVLPQVVAMTSKNGGAKVDLSKIVFATIEESGDAAKVSMKGTTRSVLPNGQVNDKEIDSVYELVKLNGRWKMKSLKSSKPAGEAPKPQ